MEDTRIRNAAKAVAERIREEAKADGVRLIRAAQEDAQFLAELLPIYRQSHSVAEVLRAMHYHSVVEYVLQRSPGAFVLYKPREGVVRELRFEHKKAPVRRGQSETRG